MATAANIADQNEELARLYKMAGIDPQGMPTEAAPEPKKEAAKEPTKEEAPSRTEQLLSEIATSLKPKPAEVQKPAAKTLSQDELFNIGLEFQKGNVKAVDDYLEKSDYLNRELSKHGVTLEDVKKVVSVTNNNTNKEQVEQAANSWLQKKGNDWPGGEINQVVMGAIMARLRLDPTDPESYEKTYQHMKTGKLVAEVPATTSGRRQASGSTSFATGGNVSTAKTENTGTPTISQAQWDKMKTAEKTALYNELVSQGHKPEDIKFVA